MAINLGGGFQIGSKQPIDDRLIMTKSEMINVNENIYPDVYMCVCSDDGAIYTFNINNEANDETGKFRIIEAGNSGGDLTDYQKKTDNTLTTTDKTITGAINEVKDSIITNLENRVTTNEADLTELQEQVDAIETNLATLTETTGMLDNILG